MAIIPLAEPNIALPQVGKSPTPPIINARAEALGALGDAIANVGRAIGSGGRRRRRTAERAAPAADDPKDIRNNPATADHAWFSKARAETALQWQDQLTALQEGYTPGTDFVKESNATFLKSRDGIVGGAPTPNAKKLYADWSDRFADDVSRAAGDFQTTKQTETRSLDLSSALTSHTQLVYNNPDQYAASLLRTVDDIEGASEWLGRPEAETMLIDAVSNLQRARAQRMVKDVPDILETEIRAGDERYALLGDDEIAGFMHEANATIVALQENDEAVLTNGSPALDADLYSRIAGDNLNNEWYRDNRNGLSPRGRKTAEVAVSDASGAAIAPSPQTALALLGRAYDQGPTAVADAADAYGAGLIDRDAFTRVYNAMDKAASAPPHVKAARQQLLTINRPDALAPENAFARHLEVVTTFDDWINAHPDAPAKDVSDMAGQLLDAETFRIRSESRSSLPVPRFAPVVSRQQMTPEVIAGAREKIVAGWVDGTLTEREVAEEAVKLKAWFEASDPEERKIIQAGFKPPQSRDGTLDAWLKMPSKEVSDQSQQRQKYIQNSPNRDSPSKNIEDRRVTIPARNDSDAIVSLKRLEYMPGGYAYTDKTSPGRAEYDRELWRIVEMIEKTRNPNEVAELERATGEWLYNTIDPRTGNEYADSPNSLFPSETREFLDLFDSMLSELEQTGRTDAPDDDMIAELERLRLDGMVGEKQADNLLARYRKFRP